MKQVSPMFCQVSKNWYKNLLHVCRASAVVGKDSIQSPEGECSVLFEMAHGI